jgi:hypothetical protein
MVTTIGNLRGEWNRLSFFILTGLILIEKINSPAKKLLVKKFYKFLQFHVDSTFFSVVKYPLIMGLGIRNKNRIEHGKTLVPPGGTNSSSVGGTNSITNGIKRKYAPY